jgi:hypothetical protein
MEPDPEQEFIPACFQRIIEEDPDCNALLNHPNDGEASSNIDTLSAAEISEFVGILSDQQKAIFGPLFMKFVNPYLSNGELAKRFKLTPQRIGQIRKEISELWENR